MGRRSQFPSVFLNLWSPSLKENKPNERCAKSDGDRHAENPKSSSPSRSGTILIVLILLIYILVGVHQVLIRAEAWRRIGRVASNLLGLKLRYAGLKLLITGHECVIPRGVHVITMVIGPVSLLVDGAIEQPPPEQTAVGIVIIDPGPIAIRAKIDIDA